MNLKDYSFILLFMVLLVTLLSFFTMFFFGDVISRNSVEIVKQYLINVALVDPSVADIIKAAKGMCTMKDSQGKPLIPDASVSPSNNLFGNSTIMYMIYGLAGLSALLFALHTKYRFNDKVSLFTGNELICLSFLMIPIVTEIIAYYFVYAKFKYFSNVYLIKLMKNLRLRADIRYLTGLWAVDSAKIENSGTEVNGVCVNNCLPSADRNSIMQQLKQSLIDYNNMLDTGDSSEWSKLEPTSLWTKVGKLPGKLGLLMTIAVIAFLCRAAYEIHEQNHTATLSIFVAIGLYILYLYVLKDYISSGTFKTTASLEYINRLFCQEETDVLSNLLHRNLIGNDTDAEIAALQG